MAVLQSVISVCQSRTVCIFSVAALRCYECVNLESSSRLFSGKSNPECDAHSFDGDSVDKVSCGSGMQCAYYTATVKETAPLSKCNSSFL